MKSWIEFVGDGIQYSISEELGLGLIRHEHRKILSVGISTAGFAEVRMALDNPQRKIIATTLDEKGLKFSQELVNNYHLNSQIELKIEDITSKLEYSHSSFDFVYARLVLHYLPKTKLQKALENIFSLLKVGGEFFVVVRSFDWQSEVLGASYDEETGFTTYPYFDHKLNMKRTSSRYLHTVGSISTYLKKAGFLIKSVNLIEEQLFRDFQRKPENKNKLPSRLIAIHLQK